MESDGVYKIKLNSPLKNKKRYFIFSYTLPKGVTVYEDIAQLNRKMVGRGWSSGIEKVRIKIELPEKVSKEKINAFGHGPLTGNIEILNGKEIVYTLDKYRKGEFVEANILFPKEILTSFDRKNIIKREAYDEIMAMERELAKKANLKREEAKREQLFSNLIFTGGIIWWLLAITFVYFKNGRRYKVEKQYEVEFKELPDDYSPAVAGTLISGKQYPSPAQLLATLMDLVRRDYLQLEESEIEGSGWFGKSKSRTCLKRIKTSTERLKDYEEMVLEWYIDEMGDGEKVVLEDIEEYVSERKNGRIFYARYDQWRDLVYLDMLSKGLKMDRRSRFATGVGIITGLGMFIGGVILTSQLNSPKFIIFSFLGFLSLPFISNMKRASKEREEAFNRWRSFKRFLEGYLNLEDTSLTSVYIWEIYFVYGIALGVDDKVAEGYKKMIASCEDKERYLRVGRRNSLMNMNMYNRAFRSMERCTFSTVNRSIKSNSSSARGSGGGFSSGSSGGGGGRGGGGAF